MSSDLVRRLRERPSRLAGESNDQRALRRQAEREAAAAHIEALEGEVATEKGTADRALMARDKAIARAERLEAEVAALRVTQERQNSDTMLLRQCYVTLAFAFYRLHESARSRDGELCLDFQRVRALIEKRFREIGIKL